MSETKECVLVQALVSELAVEGLYVSVLQGAFWLNEAELDVSGLWLIQQGAYSGALLMGHFTRHGEELSEFVAGFRLTEAERARLETILDEADSRVSLFRDGAVGTGGVLGCVAAMFLVLFAGVLFTPGVKASDSMRIARVAPGSHAAHAGLLAGDVLLAVDGSAVAEWGAVSPLIFRSEASAPVRLRVLRGVIELELSYERPQRGEHPGFYPELAPHYLSTGDAFQRSSAIVGQLAREGVNR